MPKDHLQQRLAWLVVVGSTLAAAFGATACSGSGEAPTSDMRRSGELDGGGGGSGTCATPASGCPCPDEGKTAACGSVVSHEGNHVECSEGTVTCKAGVWSKCVGDKTYMKTLGTDDGLHVQGLGLTPGNCTGDPCDPYCQSYVDTPTDFDGGADSGITVTDSGVSLVGIVTKTTSCTGLSVTPAVESLTVTSIPATGPIVYTGSPSAAFTFTDALLPAGCYAGAPPTVWTLDNPTIASISAAGTVSLVSPIATTFHVTAYSGGWSNAASPAQVNVVVNAVDTSNAPAGFTNTSFSVPSLVPDNITVLYPYSGTVLPLGLTAPTIQWSNGGTAAQAVRVQLRYPAGTGAQFTWSGILPESETAPTPTLPGQPRAFPPQNVWSAFEQTAIGSTADIVIQRIVGGVLRQPNPPINITFATGQLKGTVYYQSYGTNLVHNYSPTYNGASFGGATLAIQPGATTPTVVAGTTSECVVCHSVSASGANLTTQNGANYSQTINFNLSTLAQTTMSPASGIFAWAALSSDGSYLFSNSGGLYSSSSANSALYTVPGGSAIATTGLPSIQAASPSFSSDNAHVAFNFFGGTAKNSAGTSFTGDQASLASIDYSPSTTTFSNFQVLATPGSATVGAGTGTVAVTHNSTSITFSTAQTLPAGTILVFGSQTGTKYTLSGNLSASTTATLTGSYSGTTTAAATWSYTGNIYYPSYLPSNNQLVWELQPVSNGRGGELNDAETRSQCDSSGPIGLGVSGATNANPIVITTTSAHGLATGNTVIISGVRGNTTANGIWPVTVTSATKFSIAVAGNGNYSSGGIVVIQGGISGATNANPIVITTTSAHGLSTGNVAIISGVLGNTAANGTWPVTQISATQFSIPATGNGTYVSGGTVQGGLACQDDGTHGELWWTDVASQKSARLTNLNGGTYLPPHATALLPAGDNQLNYEPTVNPQLTGGYAWVVFTSRRAYGNIATINPFWSDPRFEDLSAQPTPKKLWVSAINPSASPGTDPSYPAFYLPGQELLAGNSRGYWVLSQCEAAGPPFTSANLCTSNLDCCPAASSSAPPVVCALDTPPATTAHCTATPSTACAANGAACTTSSQCCDFPSSVCAQNVCSPVQMVTYNPSSFEVVYNGTSCPPGNLVSWVDVGLEALTPAGSDGTNTSISIGVQISQTSSGFTPSTPVSVGTLSGPPANQSATWNNFPLSTALSSIGATASSSAYIQVAFGLTPSKDKSAAPTITDWRVRFDCVPEQ
jgi:hypothetical protein